MRRGLSAITPANANPQRQSPLFAIPSEVRNLIFEHAVCQTFDYKRPVSNTSHSHRPGHEHHKHIDTALLYTCRLVYYETRAIPLLSATHHLYEDPSESHDRRDWDHYLFHLSSQQGMNLYHLHITEWKSPFTFDTHLQPHLHWRKLTWTLCASEWTPLEMADHFNVAKALVLAHFPSTCQEVNLEYESLENFPKQRQLLRKCAEECRDIQLSRRDGSQLFVDESYSLEYTWEGTTWRPNIRGNNFWEGDYVSATYHVIRLCWRDGVPEREYMHYDRSNCLRSNSITPVAPDSSSDDGKGI